MSYLKTQSEGAMVDPDDKVANVAEDKEIVSLDYFVFLKKFFIKTLTKV